MGITQWGVNFFLKQVLLPIIIILQLFNLQSKLRDLQVNVNSGNDVTGTAIVKIHYHVCYCLEDAVEVNLSTEIMHKYSDCLLGVMCRFPYGNIIESKVNKCCVKRAAYKYAALNHPKLSSTYDS